MNKSSFYSCLLLLFILDGCHHYDDSPENKSIFIKRGNEPSYNIVVRHGECTGCSDAIIIKGKVGVPQDLKTYFGDTLSITDLKLVGRFPFDLIDPTDFFFNSSSHFKITGKIIGTFTSVSTVGKLPVFYVEKWEKTN